MRVMMVMMVMTMQELYCCPLLARVESGDGGRERAGECLQCTGYSRTTVSYWLSYK